MREKMKKIKINDKRARNASILAIITVITIIGLIFVFRNTLQGMGKPIIPLTASCVELAARSFFAIYLAKIIGYKGVFYAGPIAWIGAAFVVVIGYYVIIRNLKVSKTKNY